MWLGSWKQKGEGRTEASGEPEGGRFWARHCAECLCVMHTFLPTEHLVSAGALCTLSRLFLLTIR